MSQDPMDVVIGAAEPAAGDTKAAQRHLEAARQADDQGDRETAIAERRKAVAADPSNPKALFELAYRLDLAGEDDESLALYERCAKLQPAPVNALLNLAVRYEDNGNYALAEKALRQILDTNPNHAHARLFMKDVMASRSMHYDEEADRDLAKRNAMLDTPVTDFELSVRARNCLKKMNIRTLGDLLRITEAELLAYKNFGETSLVEIKHMLAAKGLRLGQRADEVHRMTRRNIVASAPRAGKEQSIPAALIHKPIGDMNLSVRARKALQTLGIHTIGELISRTEAELLGVKNFGQTSLVEIKERLTTMNLSLRQLEY